MQSITFGDKVINHFTHLDSQWKVPEPFSVIQPFQDDSTVKLFSAFYRKYFNDHREDRIMMLGINPGRLGAGTTGIPFTDPVVLNSICKIPNDLHQKHELSAIFIYELIELFGGPEAFYQQFYINSVCPLGFLKGSVNANYYDDKDLYKAVHHHIHQGISNQIDFGVRRDVVVCIGTGQNQKYLEKINAEGSYFDKIVAIPHPRWVMQYRRKKKEDIALQIKEALSKLLRS